MSEFWRDRIPSLNELFYALLSVLVPWCIYKINGWWHKYGDPPWKKE